jgi:hypothetical protein
MFWLKLIVIFLLLCIAYEDFKDRMVKLVYYILFVFFLLFLRFDTISGSEFLIVFVMNLTYLLLLLSMSLLVLYLRYKKITNPFLYIGVGDLILLFTFCLWFDTLNFVLFNTISLVIALLTHILLNRFHFYSKHTTIPLAGIQSLCFSIVFIMDAY